MHVNTFKLHAMPGIKVVGLYRVACDLNQTSTPQANLISLSEKGHP